MTHNIGQLTGILLKLNDSPPEWLEEEADRITEYELKTRCVMGYITSKKKLLKIYAQVENLIRTYEPVTDEEEPN